MNITLGNKVRDKSTDFEGIATSRLEYINGCVQYCVQPPVDKEGKRQDGIYLDSQYLEVIGNGIAVEAKKTGGPSSNAPTNYAG